MFKKPLKLFMIEAQLPNSKNKFLHLEATSAENALKQAKKSFKGKWRFKVSELGEEIVVKKDTQTITTRIYGDFKVVFKSFHYDDES